MIMSRAIHVTKKTFNIENELVQEMQKLIPSRKQTAFVNKALKELIAKEKKEKAKEELLKALDDLVKHAKVPSKPSVELIREIREERNRRR